MTESRVSDLMRYRRRLRSRIIISFTVFGVGLSLLFAIAMVRIRAQVETALIATQLQRDVDSMVSQVRADPTQPPGTSILQAWTYSNRTSYKIPLAWQDFGTGVHDVSEVAGDGSTRHYKLAVRRDEDLIGFLRYDVSRDELSKQKLQVALLFAVLGFSLLSVLAGIWSSRRVMQPVSDLAERLRSLRAPDDRLADHFANDEVGQLAAALDDYRDRLTDLVERDREFNADVSHELRTPLAVIATTAELLLVSPAVTDKVRDRVKRIDRAVKQSTELTEALLLLSRRSREAPTDGETTDVARVTEQVIDTQRPNLGLKPVSVRLEVEEPLEVVAPSSVVAVALANLVGNAFKYTPSGEVVVRVGDGKVIVEDSGPGIDAADAEKLFQRGVRGKDASGKGAGLGLAIVRRLCELYDWHVSL
jgi:signal transduction histidine kinase